LGGEVSQQLDLLVGKRSNLVTIDADNSDEFAVLVLSFGVQF